MIRQGSIRQGAPSVSRRTLLRALGVSGGALTLGGCASLGASETVQFYSSRIAANPTVDRKSTRLNSSHVAISYAVFCLKKKKKYVILNMTKKEKRDSRKL